jgi:hypothetical protein
MRAIIKHALVVLFAGVFCLRTAYGYYFPETQKWINRDPSEEVGGLNLFQFTANSPVNVVDSFGLNPSIQLTEAIASGNIAQIEGILAGAEGVLTESEIAVARTAITRLQQEAAKAVARAAMEQAKKELAKRCVDKTGKLANQLGKRESEVRKAIHKVKEALSRGGGKNIPKNPNVTVDPVTGDVFPQTPGGSIGDCIGNIFDYL